MRRRLILLGLAVTSVSAFTWHRYSSSEQFTIHHIRDWHYVSRERFGRDVALEGEELDKAWDAFLDDVERVQQEQVATLTELRDRGVMVVYLEGVTESEIPDWIKMAKGACEQFAARPSLLKMKTDAEALAAEGSPSAREKALKILADATTMLRESRDLRLQLGAAALVEGLEPRALDEQAALAESEPKGPAGALVYDPEKLRDRYAAWVRTLGRASDKEVIVVLGAKHNLGYVLRAAGKAANYDPITVPAVRKLLGE